MSYAFGMFFKQLSKDEDALKFIEQVKNTMDENILSFFYQNRDRYMFPSMRRGALESDADRLWVKSAFTMRFVYWAKEHLVGLSGYDYPDKVKSIFDTHFCFQNSTDQDYEFEEWSSAIDIFDRNKMAFMSKNIETLYKQGYINPEWYTLDDSKESPDYYKKSCLYEKIYNDLKLDDWLWERQSDSFVSLKINPISEHIELTMTIVTDKRYKEFIGEDTSIEDKILMNLLKEDCDKDEDELNELEK